MTGLVAEPIPGFVTSALANLHADGVGFGYRTEADIRDALAARLWFAGTERVRTEVQVPNCGRIDILCEDHEGNRTIIEVKKNIHTVSAARKAFQQADMYRAYESAEIFFPDVRRVEAYVVAGEWTLESVLPANKAFSSVSALTTSEALLCIYLGGELKPAWRPHGPMTSERRTVSAARADTIRRMLHALEYADHLWVRRTDEIALREFDDVDAAA